MSEGNLLVQVHQDWEELSVRLGHRPEELSQVRYVSATGHTIKPEAATPARLFRERIGRAEIGRLRVCHGADGPENGGG